MSSAATCLTLNSMIKDLNKLTQQGKNKLRSNASYFWGPFWLSLLRVPQKFVLFWPGDTLHAQHSVRPLWSPEPSSQTARGQQLLTWRSPKQIATGADKQTTEDNLVGSGESRRAVPTADCIPGLPPCMQQLKKRPSASHLIFETDDLETVAFIFSIPTESNRIRREHASDSNSLLYLHSLRETTCR